MTRNAFTTVIPSSRVVSSAVTQRAVAGATTSATKSKEIVITAAGMYLIKFRLGSDGGNGHAAQIYKNGTAFGALQKFGAGTAGDTDFTETLGPWEKNDLCQLYAYTTAGTGAGRVVDFRILGSYNNSDVPIPTGRVVTDTAV